MSILARYFQLENEAQELRRKMQTLEDTPEFKREKEFIDKVSERQYFNDCEVIGDDFDSELLSYCDFCGEHNYVFGYNDSYICENCLMKLDI